MASRGFLSQSETFWRDAYVVSDEDQALVEDMIIQAGAPVDVMDIASQIILSRFAEEKREAGRRSGESVVYRPVDGYEIGQQLVFTSLDMTTGVVQSVRDGLNPKYGEFQVIRVAMEGNGGDREFAAALDIEHPLNRPVEQLLLSEDQSLSEDEMVRTFGPYVAAKLEAHLSGNPELLQFGSRWLLAALLPDLHVGFMNIAEATIEVAQRALRAEEMLPDLGLGTGSPEAQLFALNRSLGNDERFDGVRDEKGMTWYLRRLVPDAIFEVPEVLLASHRAQGGEQIGLTLLDVVDDLSDELDDVEGFDPRDVEEIRYELTFPHYYAGTVPATGQLLKMLGGITADHAQVTLVSADGKETLQAWIAPEKAYMCGLKDWYTAKGMGVGAIITFAPHSEPNTLTYTVGRARSRRATWLRAATIVDDALDLQMQRAMTTVRSDPNTLVIIPDAEQIAELIALSDERSLRSLVHTALTECAKLSSRGLVHAKSVFSVVNLMSRVGAVPVFAEMTRRACYDPVGDGLWAYDASLAGQFYETADEMRERPLSTRDDLLRDQVVEYLGR